MTVTVADIAARLPVVVGAWADPDASLIDGGIAPAPELPIAALRSWARWSSEYAAMKSAPVAYAMGVLLAAAAGCLGMAREIEGRPGWRQRPALWVLLVGAPSMGKSPVLAPVVSLLRDLERDEAEGFGDVRRDYETKRQAAKEYADKWEATTKQAIKMGHLAPLKPVEADEPEKPEPPALVVQAATIEAMAPVFRHNPRGLILARDEMAGFVGNIGKYGGDGDRAFWLERYDGVGLSVRTVKAGHVQAPAALLSMIGGIQPERLEQVLFDSPDDGFIARLLLIYPDPVKPEWVTPVADMEPLRQALARLRALPIEIEGEAIIPKVLRLTPDAGAMFGRWWQDNVRAGNASIGYRAGLLGKANGLVLRLALVLEYLEWAAADGPEPEAVSRASVAAAIALLEDYLLPSTCRAYGVAGRDKGEAAAAMLARQIRHRGERTINAKTVYRYWGLPGLTASKAMNDALAKLQAGGWVRPASSAVSTAKGGRPPGDWEVNPLLWEAAS